MLLSITSLLTLKRYRPSLRGCFAGLYIPSDCLYRSCFVAKIRISNTIGIEDNVPICLTGSLIDIVLRYALSI